MQPFAVLKVGGYEQIVLYADGQAQLHTIGTSVVFVEAAYGSYELFAFKIMFVISLGLNT